MAAPRALSRRLRWSLLLLAASLLAGCALDQSELRAFAEKGYSLTGKDPFRFDVDLPTFREWGGANSAQFNRVLEEELARQNLCRGGYSLRSGQVRDGMYSVSGRCRR